MPYLSLQGQQHRISTVLDIFLKILGMRAAVTFFIFIFGGFIMAQEIPAIPAATPEFIIKRIDIRPSLSSLTPEYPETGRFRIREVNFDTSNQPREVNLAEVMEMEANMKRRTVELAPPVQVSQQNGSFSVGRTTNPGETPIFYNQSYSPEAPTRGTRNSVYRDARKTTGATWLESTSPFLRQYGPYRRFYY